MIQSQACALVAATGQNSFSKDYGDHPIPIALIVLKDSVITDLNGGY